MIKETGWLALQIIMSGLMRKTSFALYMSGTFRNLFTKSWKGVVMVLNRLANFRAGRFLTAPHSSIDTGQTKEIVSYKTNYNDML